MRELIVKAAGWHEWVWNLRFTLAQAGSSLCRASSKGVPARLTNVIEQEPRRRRIKYQILGLLVRARAFVGLGRKTGRADLRNALRLARQADHPTLLLRAAAAVA